MLAVSGQVGKEQRCFVVEYFTGILSDLEASFQRFNSIRTYERVIVDLCFLTDSALSAIRIV